MHVLASKQTLNKADIWIIFFLHNSLRNHLYKFSIICTKSGHRRTWTHSCRKIPLCNTTTARSAPIVQWNHSIAEQWKHQTVAWGRQWPHCDVSNRIHEARIHVGHRACVHASKFSVSPINFWMVARQVTSWQVKYNCHQTTIHILPRP